MNHHLNTCAFMWHLCLLTGIFVFPRCGCIFTWSSFVRYHDLSLKNDPDAVRHFNPPIISWELDWKQKMDTKHDVLGYYDKQKYEGRWLIKRWLQISFWWPKIIEEPKMIDEWLIAMDTYNISMENKVLDHFSKSVAVKLPIFSDVFLL